MERRQRLLLLPPLETRAEIKIVERRSTQIQHNEHINQSKPPPPPLVASIRQTEVSTLHSPYYSPAYSTAASHLRQEIYLTH